MLFKTLDRGREEESPEPVAFIPLWPGATSFPYSSPEQARNVNGQDAGRRKITQTTNKQSTFWHVSS